MKKNYQTPVVYVESIVEEDIITTSAGDTPWVDAFDW